MGLQRVRHDLETEQQQQQKEEKDLLGGPVVKTHASTAGEQVQSLIRELGSQMQLRSHMPHSTAKRKKR